MATSITIDSGDLLKAESWSAAIATQLPFAASRTLNDLGFQVRKDLNQQADKYFDRPTRFTQTAFLVERSTKQSLVTTVYANNQQGRNRARYLRFGIQGGQRIQKGYERALLSGVVSTRRIPQDAFLVPMPLIRRDRHGNVTRDTIKRVQQGLSSGTRGAFFLGKPRGGGKNIGKPVGIYRRSRKQLFPYFELRSELQAYKPVFPIGELGGALIRSQFRSTFLENLEQAVSN